MCFVFLGGCCLGNLTSVGAQTNSMRRQNPSLSVPEIDPGHAIRLREYLAAEQWDQAADELESMLQMTDSAWVLRAETQQKSGIYRSRISSHEYAQQWLSVAPPPLLQVFQRRINAAADRWWNDDRIDRESAAKRIVRHALFSDRGEEALLWLAATHQERGEFFAADVLLERLLSTSRLATIDGRLADGYLSEPIWLAWRSLPSDQRNMQRLEDMTESAETLPVLARLRTPKIAPADVWARRIWLSIQDGDLERAVVQLQILSVIGPDARGELMGREGSWLELLTAALARESESARALAKLSSAAEGWPQLGHDLRRTNQSIDHEIETHFDIAGEPAWWIRLSSEHKDDDSTVIRPTLMVTNDRPPTYFPIVLDECVFLNQPGEVRALELSSGLPRWPLGTAIDSDRSQSGAFWETDVPRVEDGQARAVVGLPVHAMSSAGEFVFARVGNPVTGTRSNDRRAAAQIVAFNWREQARLLSGFPFSPVGARVEFSGCPISDGSSMYVVQRKSSADSSRVAFSLVSYRLVAAGAEYGLQINWERRLCESETQASVGTDDVTQEFLTLADGVLYVNSNAGVVAAFTADTGTPLWLVEYPRTQNAASGTTASHPRFANPCVVARDLVIVAPADTSDVMAFDRLTGSLAWSRTLAGVDAIVGVTPEYVIGGGQGLVWLGRYDGIEYTSFPRRIARGAASDAVRLSPRGFGRAIHAGAYILWPTRDELYIFGETPRSVQGADRRTWYEPDVARRINLATRQASGGNLVLANGVLLIAGTDRLWAFRLAPFDADLKSTNDD